MGEPELRFRQAERTRQPDQRIILPGPADLRLIAENLVGPRRFADGGQGYRRPHIRTVLELLPFRGAEARRSEEHTSELQSLMRISYAVFCLKKTKYKETSNIKYKKMNAHTTK